ncbi:hypothetical protein SAMN06265222_1071, partial [Neorhodopirellula lusitana]
MKKYIYEWHGHKPKLLWRNGFGSDFGGRSSVGSSFAV